MIITVQSLIPAFLAIVSFASTCAATFVPPFGSSSSPLATLPTFRRSTALAATKGENDEIGGGGEKDEVPRPFAVTRRGASCRALGAAMSAIALANQPIASAGAKCTDIESCREIGESKIDADMKQNPTFSLPGGVRYKVLRRPLDENDPVAVSDGSSVDIIYSVNSQGAYMYSRGFGYEKVDFGDGRRVSDLGIDSLRVVVGRRDVPLGIERVLVGMKKGERRRVEVPPSVGFETSNWEPAPTTRRGKAAIKGYRQILEGRGTTQPPFPAATIWDIEVLKVRS